MSGALDPSAKLGEIIRSAAKTFTELGSQIGDSGFTEQWKRDALWATEVLADMLGEDLLGKFEAKSRPYLKFVFVPHLLPQLASTVEFAARLWLAPWPWKQTTVQVTGNRARQDSTRKLAVKRRG